MTWTRILAIQVINLYQPNVHERLQQSQDDGFSNLKFVFPKQKFLAKSELDVPIATTAR